MKEQASSCPMVDTLQVRVLAAGITDIGLAGSQRSLVVNRLVEFEIISCIAYNICLFVGKGIRLISCWLK